MSTDRVLNYRLYIQREESFTRTSFVHEFERYRDIAFGDVERVRQNFIELRKNYTKGKGVLSDDTVRNIRYHFVISAAMVSRMCIEAGMSLDVAYTLSDIYIRKADKCVRGDEIIKLHGEMVMDYAGRMSEIRKRNAVSIHIRKCIDYIYENLREKLTVAKAAEYLKLSPTYLSRLFMKETGMGFREFILNAKINTAKNIITYSGFSFSDISLELGFSSQSAFITAFKKITGQTPGEFREKAVFMG